MIEVTDVIDAVHEHGQSLEAHAEGITAPDFRIVADAFENGGINHAAYAEVFHRHGVRITINSRVRSVRREGNAMVASIGSDHGPEQFERMIDQVVVEHGTLPVSELYDALRPLSLNRGEVDYAALIAGRPQTVVRNANAEFRLFRIGDAVASRNIHAAIYDALRLAKDL